MDLDEDLIGIMEIKQEEKNKENTPLSISDEASSLPTEEAVAADTPTVPTDPLPSRDGDRACAVDLGKGNA